MDTELKSGIYLIRNTINDKFYIGSSNNINVRLNSHINTLRRNCHDNKHLQNSYNKHGEVFKFYIIENCLEEDLINKEQFYIDLYKPHYNISTVADRSVYKHTTEARLKMSKAKKKLYSEGFKIWNEGKKHTKETKDKISKSLKGKYVGVNHPFYNKQHNKEAKKLMIEASHRRKGTSNNSKHGKLFQLDINTLSLIDVFKSAGEAAKKLNITTATIKTIRTKISESALYNYKGEGANFRNAYGYRWIFENYLDQIKLDELLETLNKRAISSQAITTVIEGSETT